MTEKQPLEGCDRVMNNGDGHFQDRGALPLNGKRSLESDAVQEHEDADLSSSKRLKTLTVQNGVGNSPASTRALHNGFTESTNDSKSQTADTVSEMSNGDQDTSHVESAVTRSSPISRDNKLKHTNCADNTSDLNHTEEQRLPLPKATTPTEDAGAIKEGSEGGGPEIITLSDSEDEFQEVLTQAMCQNSSNLKIYQLLKLYQDQLRAEESKLILLRKLKQSVTAAEKPAASAVTETIKSSEMRNGTMTSQRGSSGNVPPPLKRGQQHSQHAISNTSQPHHHKATHHHHPTPLDKSGDRAKHANHSNTSNSAGPPPLVNMAKSSSVHGTGGSGSYSSYQSSSVSQTKKSAPAPPQLTPEQTLTAAKMVVRKQLEQALQQVPAPKPPPPEVNFLPSLASGEFIYLIGMEEVVKQLLSTDQKDVKFVFNPFSCVQCDADFTPVWKRDKPGSKNVICEKCITSNQKQVLKQEHTVKLKAVFSKALQKEQDIERRVAAGSPLSDMPGLAATVLRQQQQQSSAAISAGAPSMPQLTVQHNQSSPSPNSQSLSTNQLHQQAMLQAQAEQMRAMIAAQMLPYQLYSGGVTSKQAADIHRQYLLDMINQNRSSSWKT